MKWITVLFVAAALASPLCAQETAKVGAFAIEIPVDFKVKARHEKDSLGDMEFNQWIAKDGRVIEVLYFAGFPKQDRGPMMIAKQEPIEVGGQKIDLIETSMFFGYNEKVLVVYLRSGESICIIISKHVARKEFKKILGNVKFLKKTP